MAFLSLDVMASLLLVLSANHAAGSCCSACLCVSASSPALVASTLFLPLVYLRLSLNLESSVVALSACLTCHVLQLRLSLLVSAACHVLLLSLSLLVASACHVLLLLLSLLVASACHVLHFANPCVFGTCTSVPQMFQILCCSWVA